MAKKKWKCSLCCFFKHYVHLRVSFYFILGFQMVSVSTDGFLIITYVRTPLLFVFSNRASLSLTVTLYQQQQRSIFFISFCFYVICRMFRGLFLQHVSVIPVLFSITTDLYIVHAFFFCLHFFRASYLRI